MSAADGSFVEPPEGCFYSINRISPIWIRLELIWGTFGAGDGWLCAWLGWVNGSTFSVLASSVCMVLHGVSLAGLGCGGNVYSPAGPDIRPVATFRSSGPIKTTSIIFSIKNIKYKTTAQGFWKGVTSCLSINASPHV